MACLAQTEGVQHRFRTRSPDDADRPAALGEAADAARLAATSALRALLRDPSTVADVERAAAIATGEV